jgi:hypothetical protein
MHRWTGASARLKPSARWPSYRICYTASADLHDVPRSSDPNWSWLQRFPIGSNPLLVMAWDASGEARNLMSA